MLEDLKPPVIGRSCKVALEASRLSEKDQKILFEAIADATAWPVKTLSRALSEKGVMLSDSPITNHRKKTCVCFARS